MGSWKCANDRAYSLCWVKVGEAWLGHQAVGGTGVRWQLLVWSPCPLPWSLHTCKDLLNFCFVVSHPLCNLHSKWSFLTQICWFSVTRSLQSHPCSLRIIEIHIHFLGILQQRSPLCTPGLRICSSLLFSLNSCHTSLSSSDMPLFNPSCSSQSLVLLK